MGRQKGVSQRILVLDDGRLTDIVTLTDVTKAFERLELMRIRTHGAPWASAAPERLVMSKQPNPSPWFLVTHDREALGCCREPR